MKATEKITEQEINEILPICNSMKTIDYNNSHM